MGKEGLLLAGLGWARTVEETLTAGALAVLKRIPLQIHAPDAAHILR